MNENNNRRQHTATAIIPKPLARSSKAALARKSAAPVRTKSRTRRFTLASRLCALVRKCIQQSVALFGEKLSKQRRGRHKLEVLEVQQLGEKRFVAIVRAGQQKFLIAGAASSVSLLAQLGSGESRHEPATAAMPLPLNQETA